MAKASRAAPTAADNERAEREQNADINAAVAGTETEIFDDATGDEPLENDGDTSLEEMGDGLEGDDLDEEGDADDADGEEGDGEDGEDGDGDDDGQPAEGEAEGEEDEGEDDERQPLAARDDDTGRFVPRGRVKEEADRRRTAESELDATREQMAAMRAQLETLTQVVSGRGQQQQPKPEAQQRPPKPDMFAQPEEYEAWKDAERDRAVQEAVTQALGGFRQEQQEQLNERANVSLGEAANGPRSFEFHQAYGKLTSLDPKVPQNRTLASRILTAADPASELWSWWEKNGGPEYREQIAEQLAEQLGFELPAREQPAPRRGAQRGGNRQQPQEEQPRQVFRGPQRMRSLNDTRGGLRQQIDPRSQDDSDASVAAYAFEP